MITNSKLVDFLSARVGQNVSTGKYTSSQFDLQGSFAPALFYSTALKTDINAISSVIADTAMQQIFSLVADQYSDKVEALTESLLANNVDAVDLTSARYTETITKYLQAKAKNIDPFQTYRSARDAYRQSSIVGSETLHQAVFALYTLRQAGVTDIQSFQTLAAPIIEGLTSARVSLIYPRQVYNVWRQSPRFDGSSNASIQDMSENKFMFKTGTLFSFAQTITVLPFNTVSVDFYLDSSETPIYSTTVTPDGLGKATILASNTNFAIGTAKSLRISISQNLPTGLISGFAQTSGLEYLNAVPEKLRDQLILAIVSSAPKLTPYKQTTLIEVE